MKTTLNDIAAVVGGTPLPAEAAAREIRGVASLADATPHDISFLSSEQYIEHFRATRAGAVIVARKLKIIDHPSAAVLCADNADLAMAQVLRLFAPKTSPLPAGIHPAAQVDPTARVDSSASIAALVSIGARSSVGARSKIHPGAVIGDDVTIGDDCEIFPNVVIRERITIGSRVTIHAASAIGIDGFGYRWDGSSHTKMPHIGTVIIEDDVEIGSCTCVDRAKFGVTRIGRGSKIDNLVQIAHNCVLGPHCVLAGQCGLAGSVTLGAGVAIGGGTCVREHATMGDGAMAAACSGILDDVPPKGIVSGTPAAPHRQHFREIAATKKLPELLKDVQQLKNELAELRQKLSGG